MSLFSNDLESMAAVQSQIRLERLAGRELALEYNPKRFIGSFQQDTIDLVEMFR